MPSLDRGDGWEPPAEDHDENAPRNGRQLLGWGVLQTQAVAGMAD
jgi:hypothetical protein